MKKLLFLTPVFIVILINLAFASVLSGGEVRNIMRKVGNDADIYIDVPFPVANAALCMDVSSTYDRTDGGIGSFVACTFGTGLVYNSGVLSVGTLPQSQISGLSVAFSQKYDASNPSGFITSASLSSYETSSHAASTYATTAAVAGKANTSHTHVVADLSDASTLAKSLLQDTTQAAMRSRIGAGTSSFSGAYADLTGPPLIPSPQVQADYTQTSTGATDFIKNKPVTIHNGTAITQPKELTFSGNVSGSAGQVTFYLTNDATSGGTYQCSNGLRHVNIHVNDTSALWGSSYSLNAGAKSLTITTVRSVSQNVLLNLLGTLTSVLGAPANAPNGTTVNVLVKCY